MRHSTYIAIASITVLAAVSVFATEWAANTTGNWDDDANWGGTEPGGSNLAAIRNGTQVVNVTLTGETANRLILGQISDDVTLNISSGDLTITSTGTNAENIRHATNPDVTAVLNLTGGSLILTDDSGGDDGSGDYNLIGAGPGVAELNISGGTLTVGDDFFASGNGEVTVSGTGPTSISIADDATFNSTSQLTFVTDSTLAGVSPFDVGDLLTLSSGTLTVNLTSYDFGANSGADIILTDYGTLSGTFGMVNLIGGTGTLDYAFDQGGGDLAIALTSVSAIPEPSSFILVGLGLAGVACFYRRRRTTSARHA